MLATPLTEQQFCTSSIVMRLKSVTEKLFIPITFEVVVVLVLQIYFLKMKGHAWNMSNQRRSAGPDIFSRSLLWTQYCSNQIVCWNIVRFSTPGLTLYNYASVASFLHFSYIVHVRRGETASKLHISYCRRWRITTGVIFVFSSANGLLLLHRALFLHGSLLSKGEYCNE